MTDFIPSKLDDGDDLDFTPSVNDNLTTGDLSRKPEKYSDRHGGHDISPMNNELQRHRRTGNYQSMPGQAVVRNNDLAHRQANKGPLRDKNRTADQLGKRQPETKRKTSSKAPAAKPPEDELSQKKVAAGSVAEVVRKTTRVWPNDSATGSVSVRGWFKLLIVLGGIRF